MDREGQEILPIIEEELRVVSAGEPGGVRVHSRVVENPVQKSVSLREEQVNVERRPVDRTATDKDFDAFREARSRCAIRPKKPSSTSKRAWLRRLSSTRPRRNARKSSATSSGDRGRRGAGGRQLGRFELQPVRRRLPPSLRPVLHPLGMNYDRYRPAYQYGYSNVNRYQAATMERHRGRPAPLTGNASTRTARGAPFRNAGAQGSTRATR